MKDNQPQTGTQRQRLGVRQVSLGTIWIQAVIFGAVEDVMGPTKLQE